MTSQRALTPKELKSALSAEGFLVFRTLGSGVRLGERPRENLILDSGISVQIAEDGLAVAVEVRSEASAAPELAEEGQFQRARERANGLVHAGFAELNRHSAPVYDPGDGTRVLDVWYEVTFEKRRLSFEELLKEVRFALDYPRR